MLEHLLPPLSLYPIDETVMLPYHLQQPAHGDGDKMLRVARACAREVIVPEHIQCCGFAGDKGLMTLSSTPRRCQPASSGAQGLPRDSATAAPAKWGSSQSIAGIPYHSILYLVDRGGEMGKQQRRDKILPLLGKRLGRYSRRCAS